MNRWQQWSAKTLIFLIGLLYFILATIRDLSVPDEGRYADISRWMVLHQDYLTPRINGVPFLHKPPLLHWLTSGMLQLFGSHDWVYRLVPILASLVILSGVHWFVNRHGDWLRTSQITFSQADPLSAQVTLAITDDSRHSNDKLAKLSVIVLAFSLLFMGAGQYVNHDMLVACWITLTVLCFAGYVLKPRLSILMVGYTACALGFLSKGLIGILIPGMIILPWVLWTKNWRKIPNLLNPLGIGLLLAIDLPWLYLMNQKYPNFLHYFFIEQQFDRFSSGGFNNHQPWFFYIVCLLVSFLPFVVLISRPRQGFLTRYYQQIKNNPVMALLVWWSVSCLVFFSIPASKLIGYILPMVGPLAILIATQLSPKLTVQAGGKQVLKPWQIYAIPIFNLVIAIALVSVGFFHVLPNQKVFNLRYVQIVVVVMLVVASGLLIHIKKRPYEVVTRTVVATATLYFAIVCCVQGFDTKKNSDILGSKALINPINQSQVMPIVFYQSYYSQSNSK